VDSYTDEHYDVTLSIDTDGKPKIERIYGNKRLSELKGALKVFVKAEGLSETEEMLHQFSYRYLTVFRVRVHHNTCIKASTKTV
jgi:hypothetical protein